MLYYVMAKRFYNNNLMIQWL